MKNPNSHLIPPSGRVLSRRLFVLFTVACMVGPLRADWPNTNETKWVQYPDTNGLDVLMATPLILADDFPCTNSGPITDIHLWTSWLNDQIQPVPFVLRIWNDVPASATNPFSHPGTNLLWQQTFLAGQYQFREWTNVLDEWFWNPEPPPNGQLLGFDHVIWQYNFYPTNPFVQTGTPAQPMVYWLSVNVPATLPVGWKTSTNHWHDDAVFGHLDGQGKPVGDWMEMRDPRDVSISLDLAFALTTKPSEVMMEFGDAPDPTYPTRLASNGARHTFNPGIFLGALIDAEADGQPNAAATGDDLANLKDEDGVVFNTPLIPGQMATVTVTASVVGLVPLNAWVDFGADGSWLTPGDQVFVNQMLNAGPNVLTFMVPANAVIGPTYARFRYSTMPNLAPTGPAPNGEVEDYLVQITPVPQAMDFGDAPDQPYPTLLVNNGARHIILAGVRLGLAVDAELNGQPNATATGDDIAGVNDDDGVAYVGNMIPGQNYTVKVNASVNGFLNAWVDFNGDGSWAQAGDQVFNNRALVAGNNVLAFEVPNNATWGAVAFARFRFDTAGGLSYTGAANDGELEDYAMHVEPLPQQDLGDAPSSFNNSGNLPMLAYPAAGTLAFFPTAVLLPPPAMPYGPIHGQPKAVGFLGANVTFESNADLGPDQDLVNNIVPATGAADQDGADDGVTMPLALPHAGKTMFNYSVTFPGPPPVAPPAQLFVNVWFDWNRDGDWNDTLICPDGSPAFEWAVQNQPVGVPLPPQPYPLVVPMVTPMFTCWHPAPGVQPIWMRITIAEPPWAAPGFSGMGGDGPLNGYLYGETEDYYLTNYNAQETFDFGDAPDPSYPTLLTNNGAQHLIVPNFHLGNLIDPEADGQPQAQALGDDLAGLADDDGLALPAVLLINTQACSSVFLTGPVGGKLDGWVDFNGNGAWDAGEQVFTNLALVSGANPNLCFPVPLNAKFGATFARFRLSSTGGLPSTGMAPDGEVEDYLVNIAQPRPATNVVVTQITVTNLTSPVAQVATLYWNAETNLYYQVQALTALTNSPLVWSNVGPLILGPQNSCSETNSLQTERYYRVAVPYAWP